MPLLLLLTMASAAEPDDDGSASFGQVLDLMALSTSWSAYADLIARWDPEGGFTFDASHFNPILSARLDPQLWAELELEFESGGEVIRLEYAFLDYDPGPVTLRMGRMLVPIGEFNERLHPSFRWEQVSRPLMFESVLPAVWSDIGVQAFGELGERGRLGYAAYVVNGLGGDYDPSGPPEALRDLRDNYLDNNGSPAGGGQLRLSLFPGAAVGRTALSVSGYTGALDDDRRLRLSVADTSLRCDLGPVTILAELAGSFLSEGGATRPHQLGAYLLPSLHVDKTTLGLRWDVVRPLGGGPGGGQELAASAMLAAKTFWNLRAELGVPLQPGGARTPSLSAMSAFFF